MYRDPDTRELKKEEYVPEMIDQIFKCYRSAGHDLEKVNFADLDRAKMGLCKPYKTLLQNCSLLVGKCIGSSSIREVVMAEFLKDTMYRNHRFMGIVTEQQKNSEYFGDFSFEDCKIFGGVVASAISSSSNKMLIIISILVYAIVKNISFSIKSNIL